MCCVVKCKKIQICFIFLGAGACAGAGAGAGAVSVAGVPCWCWCWHAQGIALGSDDLRNDSPKPKGPVRKNIMNTEVATPT